MVPANLYSGQLSVIMFRSYLAIFVLVLSTHLCHIATCPEEISPLKITLDVTVIEVARPEAPATFLAFKA